MRDYSKIFKEFWTGETGRYIRSCGHEVRSVATYLFSCGSANALGIYYLPLPLLCHEVGVTNEGALKALQRLSEVDFARYDGASETVWVVNMAAHQLGERLDPRDNQVKWLRHTFQSLPKSPFLQDFYERYGQAYYLQPPRGFEGASQGAPKGLRSIEKEIEIEKEMEIDPTTTRAHASRNGNVPTNPTTPATTGSPQISQKLRTALQAMQVRAFHSLAIVNEENEAFWNAQIELIESHPRITVYACLRDVDAHYVSLSKKDWPKTYLEAKARMKAGLGIAIKKLVDAQQRQQRRLPIGKRATG